jgi:hypothetical protein
METHNEKQKKVTNRDLQASKTELVEALIQGCKTEADLFGPQGLFTELKGALMERLLEAELTEHLGYEKGARRPGTNARNGHDAAMMYLAYALYYMHKASCLRLFYKSSLIGIFKAKNLLDLSKCYLQVVLDSIIHGLLLVLFLLLGRFSSASGRC